MTALQVLIRSLCAPLGLSFPLAAHYGVTHRCNMHCRMCTVWKSGNKNGELTTQQASTLSDRLHSAGVRMITLGGGEPFIRSDLPELIKAFADKPMDVRVLTNGTNLSDAAIKNAVQSGMKHVSISLDTLDPKKEQDIYDGCDVWNEIVHSMRRFRSALPVRKSIPIMNVCVCRMNLGELPDLVRFAAEQQYFCSFVPIALSPSAEQSDGFAAAAPELGIRPADHALVDEVYSRLLRLKRLGAPIANSSLFLKRSAKYLKTGSARWKCDAGQLYLSINPEGGVSLCHHFKPIAQYNDDVASALRSPDVRREAMQHRTSCEGCMRPCWAEVTHAVRHWPSSFEAFRLTRTSKWKPYSSSTTLAGELK